MDLSNLNLSELAERASEATAMLRSLANERRLMVLCQLLEAERSAGELAARVGLSQSALSQHLAKLRAQGLVATRREAQTVWYRLADPRAARLIAVLHDLYCAKHP